MKPLNHGKNCPCKYSSAELRTQILLPYLRKLFRQSEELRRTSLQNAPLCLIKYIADCSGALLRDQIQLTPQKYKSLKKYKNSIHLLAQRKPSLKQKRDIIVSQNGAGFGFLIPLLASAIPTIIEAFKG
jgi:hypothetical protein